MVTGIYRRHFDGDSEFVVVDDSTKHCHNHPVCPLIHIRQRQPLLTPTISPKNANGARAASAAHPSLREGQGWGREKALKAPVPSSTNKKSSR